MNESGNLNQFEALFNYATIGIVVTDANGKIINFNRCAEQQFDYSKGEVLGKTIEILLPREFHASHVQYRKEFFGDPHPRRMGEGRDLYGRKKNGINFPVEVSLTYYHADQIYVIAFIVDITVRKANEAMVVRQKEELERITSEIKQLNAILEQKVDHRTQMLQETLAALEQSKEELNEALKDERELGELKSRFVTMASHEFRTPLSTILSSAYLLEKYNNANQPEKREKHIQRIKTAVYDMRSILEDFLSLGKLEEGLVNATFDVMQAEEIFAVIKDLVNELEPTVKPGQRIEYSFSGNSNVQLDKQLLRNIMLNLLSNAIKFSAEQSTIHIDCSVKNKQAKISVKDEGIGISKDDMQHLSERFFRAKNAANIQGTGLGLHIVAKYLELMNGSIDIQSELNKGTTIIITIPSKKSIYEENFDNRR